MGGTFYVNFVDSITLAKVKQLMAICTQIFQKEKPDEIYFLFASPGGEVQAGIALYNFLKALPCRITMHNTGAIDSIATVIFMAGDRRIASPGTSFHFHGVGATVGGNTRLTHAHLLELLSNLQQDENKIAVLLSSNSSLTLDELQILFRQGETKDLTFAMEKGVIHEISNPTIPADAKLVTCNFT
jgi:ATP-dependent Clp protease, protease subunit